MESSLSLAPAERPAARIAFARLMQVIGWPGLAGMALLIISALVVWDAMSKRADVAAILASIAASKAAPLPAVVKPPEPAAGKLPRRDDIPLLLTRMERAAVDNGLPWAAGDYRFVPATEHQAAALEVRTAFKAPYPKLRAMLAELIGSVPALTIREISFSRPSIDSPDVEAKFVLAVFLADDDASALPMGER